MTLNLRNVTKMVSFMTRQKNPDILYIYRQIFPKWVFSQIS